MELQNAVRKEKDFYRNLIDFIEDGDSTEDDFSNLFKTFITEKINKGRSEFTDILRLISKIAKNHHRDSNFDEKISKIINHLKSEIKQTFTNIEVFNIFKSNKLILYYLLKNKIITIDEYNSQYILRKYSKKYPHYFFDEIRPFIHEEERRKIEKELAENDQDFFDDYDKKHQQGHNCSYICNLIRNDSVEDFISYVNRMNISLSKTKINPSIFETNSFLLQKSLSLIEYAAFYGSIEIFQYLRYNHIDLTPSLWMYAIHSKNPDIIHILEENHVDPKDETYCECFLESIKCHHNEIADYFQNNHLNFQDNEQKIGESIVDCCFRYHNSNYFPDYLNNPYVFFCMNKYQYYDLVNIYLENNKKDIELSVISIIFLNQISILKNFL